VAIELLGLLARLGPVAELLPPPGGLRAERWAQLRPVPEGIDTKVLTKVRALLAKAESTTFPEEAEALTAKAAELMARHALDRAMVEGSSLADPIGRRLGIDDPYALAKAILLQVVAEANRGRAVYSEMEAASTVYAFPVDLAVIEVLYTSLLVQAMTALNLVGSGPARSRQRSSAFRRSFLIAYANRIGQRLAEATAAGVEAGRVEYGEALLPVLASRSAHVDEVVAQAFPKLVSRSSNVTDAAGWHAGRAAADAATLAVGEQIGGARPG